MARKICLVLGVLCVLSQNVLTVDGTDGNAITTHFKDQSNPEPSDSSISDLPIGGKRVAIIGAGVAGASTAFYLRRFLSESTFNSPSLVSITIFEKESQVGGRALTVDAYDDPDSPVEVGAAILTKENEILLNAIKELNIETEEQGPYLNAGIFNGSNILYPPSHTGALTFFGILKTLIHRYNPMDFVKTEDLAQGALNLFRRMYKKPIFPFQSLSEAANAAGLYPSMSVTAQQFLINNGIDDKGSYARDIIQGTTRTSYSQNLGKITGLQALLSLSTHNSLDIKGGNWKLFKAMIDASNVALRLNTSVISVSMSDNKQWIVKSKKKDDEIPTEEIYDAVIIAGPLQCSNVVIEPELPKIPSKKNYAKVHVTLFTSPKKLDPIYFGMKPNYVVPGMILTSLTESENLMMRTSTGENGVGSSGFYCLYFVRPMFRDVSSNFRVEYLYKIFSPELFSDDKIQAMLGVQHNIVKGEHQNGEGNQITWIYRHTWNAAYPQQGPEVEFDEIKIENGLWYTAGIETLVSTLETNSLMGMNIAKLIVEEWDTRE